MPANPAAAQFLETSRGLSIHYTDHPATGAESGTLVFIHGSGPGASGWSNFKHNIAAFQVAGYRCVVYDQWGYGKTDKPTDIDHTLDFFVEGLTELLDGLALQTVTLVGNSLGGAVALGMALTQPQRVNQLILMAPGGIESREAYFAMEGIQTMVKHPMGSPEFTRDVLAKLLTLLVYKAEIVDQELIDERWTTLQTQNSHVLATMAIPDLSEQIGQLEQPMLVFWGTEDKFCPASGVWKILKGAGNVQAELLNHCGHWVMTEYPALFNRRSLEFLSKTPSQ
ncbi:alpha/beta fold hydrolase [Draconibacterium sp.]|nr:alpha/beta fold hydrolase [Luminiphilus sp.]MDB4583045.1 alpha/beta fold hydrolase [Draconibacterium sp.]